MVDEKQFMEALDEKDVEVRAGTYGIKQKKQPEPDANDVNEGVRTIREQNGVKVASIDEPGPGGARHQYRAWLQEGLLPCVVHFQCGPIAENGVNGCQNEDLLAIVIDRLRDFQAGPFACRENAIALTNIEQALMWLEKRTTDRQARGVEGRNEK